MAAANKIQVGYIEAQDGAQFQVDAGTAAAPGLVFDDSAATGLYSPGTGQIAWSTSGKQTALRILADGKVGIDCSPTVALEVNGTIKASAIDAPIEGTLDDWIVHAGDTNTKIGFSANDTFQVQTGGSARLTVTDSATTIANTATFTGNSVVSGSYFDIQNNKKLRLGTNGDCSFYFNGSATLIETGNKIIHIQTDASIRLQKNDPQAHMLIANAGGSVDLYHNGTLKLATDLDGIRIGSGGGDNTIVDLHNASYDNGVIQYYNGSINLKTGSSNGDRLISLSTAGSERLRIHADGEVEIKEAANGQTVLSCTAAYASGSTVNIQTWARSDGAVKAAMKYSHGANSMNMGTTSNHNFTLRTNDTERIRIMSGGSVNIGGDYAQTSKKFKVTGNSTIDGGLLVTGLLEGGSGFSIINGNLTLPAYTYHDGDSDTYYGFSSANQFSVYTGGAERLKIDANGVVKVTRRLELTNSGDNHYVHEGRSWAWTSNGTSTGTPRGYLYGDSSGNLRIGAHSDWGEDVRITSGGQVNIGGDYTQTAYQAQITGDLLLQKSQAAYQHPQIELYATSNTAHGGAIKFSGMHSSSGGKYEQVVLKAYGGTGAGTGSFVIATGTGTDKIRLHSTGQMEFKNGSFSSNVDCVMGNGGTLEIGAQATIKFRTATNETVRIDNNQRVAIGPNAFTSTLFGQGTPITSHNPRIGIDGSVVIGNLNTGTTSRCQLQFYRRNGTSAGSSISSHNMGEIAWYGSSNDNDNSNMAWSIGVTATGGSWTSGANRTGRMLFTNHDGEMARFTEKGVFNGRPVVDYDSTGGNSRWTTSGAWKVVVDLAGWPQNCLYICDASMQFLTAYIATFWVYKTRQSQYKVIHDQDSICHWRINGSQIEIQQNSGVDQTNTTGYQKIYQSFGMH